MLSEGRTHDAPHEGEWTSEGEAETFALGQRLGARLTGGEILLLDGPLGARRSHARPL